MRVFKMFSKKQLDLDKAKSIDSYTIDNLTEDKFIR